MTSKHHEYSKMENSNDENKRIKPVINRMVQLEDRNQQQDEEKEDWEEWSRGAKWRKARGMKGVNGQRI